MKKVFALVDGDSFFAACEQIFRPALRNVPVIVLSSNDGNVVARSKLAKELGIKMGVPVFQIRELIRQHNIEVFSSNFVLYGDISNRMMQTLAGFAPRQEIYSIDECFLDLTGFDASVSLLQLGKDMKARVAQWVGISVGVGIGPTKTLAKLANFAAKKYPATGGVVDLTERERQLRLMAITPVGEVWGVGRKIKARLEGMGIETALDLANSPTATIRKQFSIVLERTVLELNGVSCLELEEVPATKQQIMCSRSFGTKVKDFEQMSEAVSSYLARACEKLRIEGQQAKVLSVFIQTSQFQKTQPMYSNSATGELVIPSCDTRDLTELAMQLLKGIWREGYWYNKAGVMLTDFYDVDTYQPGFFDEATKRPNSAKLMATVDKINQSGLGKVFLARQGTNNTWSMKRDHLSPAYTTRWSDIPTVR